MNYFSEEAQIFGAGAAVGIFIFGCFLYFTGNTSPQAYEKMQRQAIECGAAHWTIDPVTGEKSFTWRTK